MVMMLSLLWLSSACRAEVAPYPPSSVIAGIRWASASSVVRLALGSDNFPTTWADDDNIYTAWGDGAGFGATYAESQVKPYRAGLGVSRISGGPANMTGVNVFAGKNALNPDTFGGKSYGILSVGGVLYMLQGPLHSPPGDEAGGWDAAIETTVATSYDHAATWTRTGIFLSWTDGFCSPGFLNFGKDNAGARDNYVYIYGLDCSNGSSGPYTKISLARVPKDKINDRSFYTFYAGQDSAGNPIWAGSPSSRAPVFVNPNSMVTTPFSAPSVIYNAGINRYLLVVTHGTAASPAGGLGIYDGPSPWGPWTTAYYADNWNGSSHMFYANIPTKWISSDGKTFYLIFTGYNPDVIAQDAYQHIQGTITLAAPPPETIPR